jgi:hypothetical protein
MPTVIFLAHVAVAFGCIALPVLLALLAITARR